MSEAMSEAELLHALRQRYAAPEWAFLEQVRNGTGAGSVTRTADAVAMGLWPSRGMEVHGFELKVSRSDVLRELKDPAKAEEIARFCDRWFLVVGDAAHVKPGELPPTWGLLAPKAGKLVVKVEASKLTAQPLDRTFVASVLRNAASLSGAALAKACAARESELRMEHAAAMEKLRQQHQSADAGEAGRLRAAILEFYAASGVNILAEAWRRGRIGAAVRLLAEGGAEALLQRLKQMEMHLAEVSGTMRSAITEMEGSRNAEAQRGAGHEERDGGEAPGLPMEGG